MSPSNRICIFTVCIVAFGALSACSGTAGSVQSAVPGQSGDRQARSFPVGERSTPPMVYASIPDEGYVYGFNWQSFDIAVQLTLSEVQGLCSDRAGNVFVPTGPVVYEYAHGASTPKVTLENTFEGASCAVDPTSGDLAVLNDPTRKGAVTVNIFSQAQGKPKTYSFSKFAYVKFGSYDNDGNLFLDGMGLGSRGFLLTELPSNKTKFVNILVRKYIGSAGGVVWDGQYLAIADGKGAANSPIYRFAISGKVSKLQGSVTLDESCGVQQFAVYKGTVVAASGCTTDADLAYWKYPEGGSPVAASGNWGDNLAYGVTLSP
jgi:hypothetical protein